MANYQLLLCDARRIALADKSVQCCITSPPYWALRSYLPGMVRLRAGLSPEQAMDVLAELNRRGINPLER
jgi:hypothetical protein